MMCNPALLTRIKFRSQDELVTPYARVYLMVGMLHRKSNEQVVDMLKNIFELMIDSSRLVIVDSILSDSSETPLATKRMWHCRDMAMRQLQNSGDGTLSKLEKLAKQASNGSLILECCTYQPGTTISTVVFRDMSF